MTKIEVASQVDDLGRLRDRLHGLKFQETALTESLKAWLRKQKAGHRTAQGCDYEAELSQGKGLVIDDLARFRRAAGRKFLHCVRVDLTLARSELGAEKVAALGRTKKGPDKLRVYKREPGKAPRKAPARRAKK